MKNETGNEPTKILNCEQSDCKGACMSEASYTPGPWKVDGSFVVDQKGSVICDTTPAGPNGDDEVNARLIAAAPELLQALTLLFKEVEAEATESMLDGPLGDALVKAHDAIAKAEKGER
jgi:hypothetical protein